MSLGSRAYKILCSLYRDLLIRLRNSANLAQQCLRRHAVSPRVGMAWLEPLESRVLLSSSILVDPLEGSTGENGSTLDIAVVLGAAPTAAVTIPVSSSDTTEGVVSVNSLTFNQNDWNIAQTITVTGVDDGIDDGQVAYSIILSPASSNDANYNGLDAQDVTLRNTDDDTAGNDALAFDGIDGYISVPDDPSLRNNDNMTIAFWVQDLKGPGQINKVMGKGINIYQDLDYAFQFWNNDAIYRYHMIDGNGNVMGQSNWIGRNTWTHVASTLEPQAGGGYIGKLYINGELKSTRPKSNTDLETTTYPLEIGRWATFFEGQLDDVTIYHDTLTESDIQDLMHNGPSDLLDPDLKAYYSFDAGTVDLQASTVEDLSIYGNDGQILGGVSSAQRPVDVIVDDRDGTYFTTTGTWSESGAVDEYVGGSLVSTQVGATATWTPTLPQAGAYEVYVWSSGLQSGGAYYDRDSQASYEVTHRGVTHTYEVDQDLLPGQWVLLDTLIFSTDGTEHITLTSSGDGVDGTSADAVRFVKVADPELIVTPTKLLVPEGTSAAFAVSLSEPPIEDLVLSIVKNVGDDADLTADVASLTFTDANWDTPQLVKITSAIDTDMGSGLATFNLTGLGVEETILADTLVRNAHDDALAFDGIDGYISVPDDPSLRNNDNMTIAFWVQDLKGPGQINKVMGKGTNIFGELDYGVQFWDNDAIYRYHMIDGNGNVMGQNAKIGRNTWTHVASTLEPQAGGGYVGKLYINGELKSTRPKSNTDLETTTYPLEIGRWLTYFEGQLDELTIYHDTLTGSAIQDLMHNGPSDLLDPALKAYYSFDADTVDLQVNIVEDQSIYGNDGQILGGVSSAQRPVDVIVDDRDTTTFTTTSTWSESGAVDEYVAGSLFSTQAGATATWTPTLPQAGAYEVYVWSSGLQSGGAYYDRDSQASYEVIHRGMTHTYEVDQDLLPGQWVLLDTLIFSGDGTENITLTSSGDGVNGTSADAVRFIKVADPELIVTPNTLSIPRGGSASFTVRLSAAPVENVAISVTKNDEGDPGLSLVSGNGGVSSDWDWTPTPLTTAQNWNIPRTVTIYSDPSIGQDNGMATFTVSEFDSGLEPQTIDVNVIPAESLLLTESEDASLIEMAVSDLVELNLSEGTRTLRFDVVSYFDTTDQDSAVEDTFLAYLVDDTGSPAQTLLDRGVQGTAFFSLAGDRVESTPGKVRFDGRTVEVDLTTLSDLTINGKLVFQLVNSDNDDSSWVAVLPYENETDSDGQASVPFPMPQPAMMPSGALDLSTMSPTQDLDVLVSNVRVDVLSGTGSSLSYTADIRVLNNGNPVGRDIAVVWPGLFPHITAVSPSGTDSNSNPYISMRDAIPAGGLGTGAVSQPVQVQLLNTTTTEKFILTPQVLVGPPNQAPVLDPIGPLSVMPGDRLEVGFKTTKPYVIDQDSTSGQWVSLGQFDFAADGNESVQLTRSGIDPDPTIADAIRWVNADDATVEVIVDNQDATGFTTAGGTWSESGAVDEYANSSLYSYQTGATATWTPDLPVAGAYEVFAWWRPRNS